MSELNRERGVNVFFISGMVIAWAAYYIASDWGVGYTSSAFVAGMLLRAAAFVFLTVYLLVRGKFLAVFKQGKLALILLVIGILGFLLDTFANLGFQHGSVGTGTVLLKTDILMANVVCAFVFKDKLRWTDWLATAIMLAGVVCVLDIDFADVSVNWYDLFFIASAVAVTANAFVIKGAQQKYNADSDIIAYYNNFVVLVLFVVSAFASGDAANLTEITLDWRFFLVFIGGGLAQSLIYIFYYRNLRCFPVWEVKLYLLFVPVISCVVGSIAFDESFGWMKGLGVALVLIGAALIVIRTKLAKKPFSKQAKLPEEDGDKEENDEPDNEPQGDVD